MLIGISSGAGACSVTLGSSTFDTFARETSTTDEYSTLDHFAHDSLSLVSLDPISLDLRPERRAVATGPAHHSQAQPFSAAGVTRSVRLRALNQGIGLVHVRAAQAA
ncbi:hypothetical protein [Rhodopseudomonas palustris]|uniref:hypothetical protein n=1 Tax=Rhodopseudomonas palustris TaxID=1076 RepID=UPI00142EFDBC